MNPEAFALLLLPRLGATVLQSSLLVAAVWALCRVLPGLPAAARCRLWWLVALQLVVGLVWSAPVELPLLAAPADPIVPAPGASIGPGASAAGTFAPATPATGAATSAWTWPQLLVAAWLAGVVVAVVRTLLGLRTARRILAASRACTDADVLLHYAALAEACGIRRPAPLRMSDAIASPQIAGALRPVLLLPASHAACDGDLDMMLRHELAHLRRNDLCWGWLPALARHLFFFHPLAHLAVREYALAREAACDAEVLAQGRHSPRDYGRLLLRLGARAHMPAALAGASPTFRILSRRLAMLQIPRTSSRALAAALTVAVAVAGVVPYRVTAGTQSDSGFMPRPPAPPAPPAPDAPRPPAPPAPPSGPDMPAGVTGLHIIDDGSSARAYVAFDGSGHVQAHGTGRDVETAHRQYRSGDAMAWFRRGEEAWVIRDPATLKRLHALHAPLAELAAQQGELGERQGELGAQQGELGARQGELGAKQGEIAARHAQRAARAVARGEHGAVDEELEQDMEALAAEQRRLAERQKPLAARQQELGRRQQALGERHRALAGEVERQVWQLLDAAVADGTAVRADG
ncbi:M56 family metallopeptidase [Coralloluteibacterium stylophorae]|uniref:Peptidase M56 domain-containing protein n=1 Tax=Coralloluteibacterium stylophorae TaxID=1776034 RepID=A0A8J7VVQ7_9GAMM|nr:M56 family metallopeptidase [Coralloluteibacterium stylophorae]MBS7456270.1 hypothetical protein [Coralloluteibacterium stylophorae]